MALSRARAAIIVMLCAVVVAALAYLRDPPWAAGMTTGLAEWRTDDQGVRFRWAGSHASFFVPSGAAEVTIPLRAPFDSPNDWSITATISIDGRPADRITFEAPSAWRRLTLRLPPPGGRRHRRINIRLDRTRAGNHGVMVGEVLVR